MTHPNENEIRELVRRMVAELGTAADAAAGGVSPPAADPASAPAPGSPGGAAADGSAGRAASPAGGQARRDGDGAGRRVAVGGDHGGFALKNRIAEHLRKAGWEVEDCGTHGTEACDYPDFAHAVASAVAAGRCRAGVVVDGAGIGSAMVANKVPGVRASLCYDLSSAKNAREHNHANVLTLGAGLLGEALALQIVDTWLGTAWGGDRHARRVEKIMQVEGRYLAPAPAPTPAGTRS